MTDNIDPAKPNELGGEAFKPIATQADLDRIIGDRLARERAKFDGFDELKAKAEKLDKLEQANKTEAQRQADALAAVQAENAELKAAQARADVAAAKGVPASLLKGATPEELEAEAEELLKFRGEQSDHGAPQPPQPRLIVESESGDSTHGGDDNSLRAVAKQIFGPKN